MLSYLNNFCITTNEQKNLISKDILSKINILEITYFSVALISVSCFLASSSETFKFMAT